MLTLANVRVRNVATVGGNLAHGDPHLDLPPVWIALGATVHIVGTSGRRDAFPSSNCSPATTRRRFSRAR